MFARSMPRRTHPELARTLGLGGAAESVDRVLSKLASTFQYVCGLDAQNTSVMGENPAY